MLHKMKKNFIAIIAFTVFSAFSVVSSAKGKLAVDKVEGEFSIMVLGSGGGVARATSGGRAQASILVFIDGKPKIMLDAGGGSYQRLAESGVDIRDLDIVLLSHLHIDHTANLAAMIRTIYFEHSPGVNPGVAPRSIPLKIFGPGSNNAVVGGTDIPLFPTTSEYIEGNFDRFVGAERYAAELFEDIVASGDFVFDVTDINASLDLAPQIVYNEDGLLIKAVGVNHFTAPSLAYSIEYKGHKFTYSGDLTGRTNNIIDLAINSDLLIYDASVVDNTPSGFHTTPQRIAEIAQAAQINDLVLSNISLFVDGRENLKQTRALVRAGGYSGRLRVANDLSVYNLMADQIAFAGYPYKSNYVPVQGRFMHYLDEGKGENTVVMLHGNPTSSYLYRNIIPHLSNNNRVIVPDLLNHGLSDFGYGQTYAEHYAALDEFIEVLDLDNIIFLIQDWGGLLGFTYASQHQDKIKGISFFEAPVRPYEKESDLPEILVDLRRPEQESFVLETNFFIEEFLFVTEPSLSEADKLIYREPFLHNVENVRQSYTWVREVPARETSNQSIDLIDGYASFLRNSSVPKLYFYAEPGVVNAEGNFQDSSMIINTLPNLESVFLGPGLHYLQESYPDEIGEQLNRWIEQKLQ